MVRKGQAVVEPYRRQFEADAEHFFRLRALEFAPGGLLLAVVPGAMGDCHCNQGSTTAISDAAAELCAKGKIDASLLEDFLFPVYLPTEDVRCSALAASDCSLEFFYSASALHFPSIYADLSSHQAPCICHTAGKAVVLPPLS